MHIQHPYKGPGIDILWSQMITITLTAWGCFADFFGNLEFKNDCHGRVLSLHNLRSYIFNLNPWQMFALIMLDSIQMY